MGNPTPPVLYHYTSFPVLEAIANFKTVRATYYDALNDREELSHANSLLRRLKKSIDDDQKALIDKAMAMPSKLERTCIASFTEERDLLSQWRAYAGSEAGICIGFDSSVLKNLRPKSAQGWNVRLEEVLYEPAKQVRKLMAEVLRPKTAQGMRSALDRVALRLKDPHFHEEREWRLICTPSRRCWLKHRETPYGPAIYVDVPVKAHEFRRLIRSVTIGPAGSEKLSTMRATVRNMLRSHDVVVHASQAPLKP